MLPDTFEKVLRRPWPGRSSGESAQRTRDRRAAMRMVLERFVRGGHVSVERDLTELGSKVLRPAHRGWWEFRSGLPDVQTRLFGFFARPSAFVAVELLARDVIDFTKEHGRSVAAWNSLAPGKVFMTSPYPVENQDHLKAYMDLA